MRDCDNCVYSTRGGGCRRFECSGTVTVDDIRIETIGKIEKEMYHECFEVDHDKDGMQKWDSGNWLRYKLFEKVIEKIKEGELE